MSIDAIRRRSKMKYQCRSLLPKIITPICIVYLIYAWLSGGVSHNIYLLMIISIGVIFGIVGILYELMIHSIKREERVKYEDQD